MRGGVINRNGIDIPRLLSHVAKEKTVMAFPGCQSTDNERLFEIKCDIVVPAALGGVLTGERARKMDCRLVAEAANNPTTREADEVFEQRGIPVIPDILCNAGGVTVSYFEWAQNLQQYRWDLEQVNKELSKIMSRSFRETHALVKKHKVTLRTAAYLLAIDRVAEATRLRVL